MSDGGLAPEVERLLQELTPKVVGAVTRRCGDFAAAEDAVQEALLAAFAEWPARGVPANPGGWLFHAAWRRLADVRRSERARARREALVAAERPEVAAPTVDEGAGEAETVLQDETLVLLFLCCHPSLSDASAIALTLRAVGGLTTAEIARAFLVPEATMAQRISRAKRTIAESRVTFELPDESEQSRRLDAVLRVLYLIFNEGYVGSSGASLQRVELASEAIRLARALRAAKPGAPEVDGLLALLLLTDARRLARTGPAGELVPLDEQERGKWDRAQIAEGSALVGAAFAKGAVGKYQLQAAIAALHDEAPSTDATDWPQIVALYDVLRRIDDQPMVALSHAIAVAMVQGPAAGLKLLEALDRDARIAGHWRLAAVRGHLHERAGDRAAARRHFLAAADGTKSVPERHYLLTKAARLKAE